MHIFVLLFWLKMIDGTHVSVESVELTGIAPDAETCQSATLAEISKHADDFATNVAAGLTPKIVCGIAAPERAAQPPSAPADGDQPGQGEHPSPGHGDWDKGSSAGV